MNTMGCCPNHDTYIMLIIKFCRWGELENVSKLWNEMISNGLDPDRSSDQAASPMTIMFTTKLAVNIGTLKPLPIFPTSIVKSSISETLMSNWESLPPPAANGIIDGNGYGDGSDDENARSINVVASDVDQSTKSSYMSHRSNDYHHQQQQQVQKVTEVESPPPAVARGSIDDNGYGCGDGDNGVEIFSFPFNCFLILESIYCNKIIDNGRNNIE
ncbi:hypothetical protein L6452_31144 [Arctium lappa]|uniref:Uncharacterized protein n=1 Tax=Arctium lappa TaxID=4217 RepID=A0ACB8ZL38_ARCLA|nr:hypothetical protein L6452_31144 [Arctium lappa]